MSWYDCDETDRAVEAYFRRAEREGLSVAQPNRYDSEFDPVAGLVTLRGGSRGEVLARYRVKPDGGLRRLTSGRQG
jgi:hypothetical protein